MYHFTVSHRKYNFKAIYLFKLTLIALVFSDSDTIVNVSTNHAVAYLVFQYDLRQKLVVIAGFPLPKQ